MRGRPSDYDEWDATAARRQRLSRLWRWADVLPHFRGMEGNNRLNDERHGADGPLLVSDPGHIDDMSRWFVQSVQALGVPFNHDFNGPTQRGVGFYQFTNRRGQAQSARPTPSSRRSSGDPNLTIRLNAPRASHRDRERPRDRRHLSRTPSGEQRRPHADGEVIVAAGALVTPKLLMLSGIGPADHLRAHGIELRRRSAGRRREPDRSSGSADHRDGNGRHGYYRQGVGWRMLLNGLQFKLFGTGRITSPGVEAGAFVNPADPDAEPTIQAFCVPIVYLDRDTLGLVDDTHGVTITTVVVKPKSRGFVRLRSADPTAMPLVSPNLLKHPADMRAMIDGQRFFLRAFQTSPLASDRARSPFPIRPI